MKRFFLLFVIFNAIAFIASIAGLSGANFNRGFVNTVVIDPGHGGRDPGALGQNSKEKDIALSISLKVGNYIENYLPDVNVIYTRTEDVFVNLNERAEIANKNNADLFISIHCNASPNRNAIGTETFVMGLTKSEDNLAVAKKENAAILFEEDYMDAYDGYDPHSSESHIIFSLYQNAHLNQSIEVASLIQNQFRDRARRVDRGVKQGPFIVLWRVTMPSVLIEVGFLDNPIEEKYLMSESGQNHIASAIFRAFRDYKQEQDELAMLRQRNQKIQNNVVESGHVEKEKDTSHLTTNIAEDKTTEQSAEQVYEEGKIYFKVQFAAAQNKRPLDSPEFDDLDDVSYYFHEGLYKYTAGKAESLSEAVEIQSKLQNAGFKDAFVVAFYNNERISASEAMRILQADK